MILSSNFSTLRKLNQITELAKPKDVLAITDSREIAEELKQNIVDAADAMGHYQTGKLERSIGVRNMGNGDWGVTGVDYAKYVNGRDRDNPELGEGFIDEAVAITTQELDLDSGDIEVLV